MTRLHAIGIDLGKDGWAVLVDSAGRIEDHSPTPVLADGSYDEDGIVRLLARWSPLAGLAVLEDAATIPGQQSAKTGLAIGLGLGLWRMALRACEIPREVVSPREWKGVMGCLVDAKPAKGARKSGLDRNELRQRAATVRRRQKEGGEITQVELELLEEWKATSDRSAARRKAAKGASAARAQELFPGVDFRASERAKTLHDGKCEAALIAAYALRRLRGQA